MNIYRFSGMAAVTAAMLLTVACDSDNDTTVYIPETRTLQIRNFDLGEELVETFHVAVTGSDYVTSSGMEVGRDVTVTLAVDADKVESFNRDCGTSYSLLPDDCYTLATEARIDAGSTCSADITLRVDARGKIQPFDSYLLPVSIVDVDGAVAGHDQRTVYYLLSGAEDVWNMPLADRSDWSIVSVSSEETSGEGSENGHAIHAFDGLTNTFWHTQWKGGEPQPPHDIVVDMGCECKMLGWQFITRDHGSAWPQEITIETSLDGNTWEGAGTYSDLPAGGGKEYRSYLPGFKQARYFRLTITAVYSGSWSTHIAEINAITL